VVLAPACPALEDANSESRMRKIMADEPKEPEVLDVRTRKAVRAVEGAKAMSEYVAERDAERAKTARLRALRLAKEAAEKEAKPVTKKKRVPGTSKTDGAGARLKE
jgi:hypothetical protein